MNNSYIPKLALIVFAIATSTYAMANENTTGNSSTPSTTPMVKTLMPHCEVPCGIYADQMRFEQMLEDTATIAKAIASIQEFTSTLGEQPPTATDFNQASRWISTKEEHATKTQHIVAQYFLTQRIKEDNKDYSSQLITAHKVMVAAMKCKQSAEPQTAENLKKAIHDLYRAYEGKEPSFDHKDK